MNRFRAYLDFTKFLRGSGRRPPFWPDSLNVELLVNDLKDLALGPHTLLFNQLGVLNGEMGEFLSIKRNRPTIEGLTADPFKIRLDHLVRKREELFPDLIRSAEMAGLDFSACLKWQVEQVRLVRNGTCHHHTYLYDPRLLNAAQVEIARLRDILVKESI